MTGIDLVREQFRIAEGQSLDYPDPVPHAHSIEFRINGEDAGRGFLPAPGTVTVYKTPSGPGVRVDSGLVEGDTIAGAFDSMLAKLIVTGRDRQQALERSQMCIRDRPMRGSPSRATQTTGRGQRVNSLTSCEPPASTTGPTRSSGR